MLVVTNYPLPNAPGVYLFHGAQSEILYIGKAKNIKKRVTQYQISRHGDWKITALLSHAIHLSWIITNDEREALYLEAEMITTIKPIFNTLLSGDSPFFYLLFSSDQPIPLLKITRYLPEKNTALVIGPFLERRVVYALKEYIEEAFSLGSCGKKIPHGCLAYHLKKCAGTCSDSFSLDAFISRFSLAKIAMTAERESFIASIEPLIQKSNGEERKRFRLLQESIDLIQHTIHTLFAKKDFAVSEALHTLTSQKKKYEQGLATLKSWIHKEKESLVIDCIDISHHQGKSAVGVVVRFDERMKHTVFFRKQVHHENDDYKNIEETLMALKEHYAENGAPHILLIDGGKGQLSAANKIFSKSPIALFSLAKKEERLFFLNNREERCISAHEPEGAMLIALRNATHYAALFSHRSLFYQSIIP